MRFANDTHVMRTLTDSTTTMPKTKRLTVRELRNIAKDLKNVDLGVSKRSEECQSRCRTKSCGERSVQKEQHVHFFHDRKALWCFLIGNSSVAFQELLKDGIDRFCSMYADECSKECSSQQQRIEHPSRIGCFDFAVLVLAG